ncbi:MAG: methyltransferase domain-containing protein, partial [Acetobacteraceae bacterium]
LKGMPMARGLGTDISDAALQVAVGNTRDLGLEARARFRKSDWFASVTGPYDLIVSNPPYIAADEMPALSPEVLDWEPHLALSPGGDGLDAYRAIAQGAGARLMPGGRLLVEIGPTQARSVAELFRAAGMTDIRVLPDMDGRDRVVGAIKAGGDSCGCA